MATGRIAGGSDLLNQIERHLRVDVRFGVDWVSPAVPQRLLDPFLAASGTTDELNAIQYDGRRELFPECELKLGKVGKNLGQEFRISGIRDVVFRRAAGSLDVAGDGRHNEQLKLTELCNQLFQELHGVV